MRWSAILLPAALTLGVGLAAYGVMRVGLGRVTYEAGSQRLFTDVGRLHGRLAARRRFLIERTTAAARRSELRSALAAKGLAGKTDKEKDGLASARGVLSELAVGANAAMDRPVGSWLAVLVDPEDRPVVSTGFARDRALPAGLVEHPVVEGARNGRGVRTGRWRWGTRDYWIVAAPVRRPAPHQHGPTGVMMALEPLGGWVSKQEARLVDASLVFFDATSILDWTWHTKEGPLPLPDPLKSALVRLGSPQGLDVGLAQYSSQPFQFDLDGRHYRGRALPVPSAGDPPLYFAAV